MTQEKSNKIRRLSTFHPIQPIFLPYLFLFLFVIPEDRLVRWLVILEREPHHVLLEVGGLVRIPGVQDLWDQTVILLRALS